MARGPVQQWFVAEIASGLQRLISLSLPGPPAMETIQLTASSWAEVLWESPTDWHAELDQARLPAAFKRMMRDVERWPAPKALLQYLPPRPQPTQPLLAGPQISEEQRKRNLARIRELGQLFKGKRA